MSDYFNFTQKLLRFTISKYNLIVIPFSQFPFTLIIFLLIAHSRWSYGSCLRLVGDIVSLNSRQIVWLFLYFSLTPHILDSTQDGWYSNSVLIFRKLSCNWCIYWISIYNLLFGVLLRIANMPFGSHIHSLYDCSRSICSSIHWDIP